MVSDQAFSNILASPQLTRYWEIMLKKGFSKWSPTVVPFSIFASVYFPIWACSWWLPSNTRSTQAKKSRADKYKLNTKMATWPVLLLA